MSTCYMRIAVLYESLTPQICLTAYASSSWISVSTEYASHIAVTFRAEILVVVEGVGLLLVMGAACGAAITASTSRGNIFCLHCMKEYLLKVTCLSCFLFDEMISVISFYTRNLGCDVHTYVAMYVRISI